MAINDPTSQVSTPRTKKPVSRWVYAAIVVILGPFIVLYAVNKNQGSAVVNELYKVDQLSLFSYWNGSFDATAQGSALCLDRCTSAEETFYAHPSSSLEDLEVTLRQFLENQGYISVIASRNNTGHAVTATGSKGKFKMSVTVNASGGYSRATVSY